jgi:hypothetical protein
MGFAFRRWQAVFAEIALAGLTKCKQRANEAVSL